MSHFFSRIAVILCVLALAGCDYYAEDDHFVEESIISKRLKEIGVGEYKYLRDIHGEQWEKVCVLPPYYGVVIGLSDEKKEAFIIVASFLLPAASVGTLGQYAKTGKLPDATSTTLTRIDNPIDLTNG